ncbi:MAG: ABC transporter permease [Chthoniobacterales bacterium]
MAEATTTELKKETIISTESGWFDIDWRELWASRELIFRLFHRDFSCSYKQTIFGYTWFIIPPVINTLVYGFMFGTIGKISTGSAPKFLFYFLSVLIWNFFSSNVNKTAGTFTGNSGLFSKVYFPRFVVPVAGLLSNLLTLSIQVVLFTLIYGVYMWNGAPLHPGVELLWVPVIVFLFGVLGIGGGLFIASLTTTYRDMGMLASMALQLLMFGSCVLNPLSEAPAALQPWMALNPVVPLMETLRYALFGSHSFYPGYLCLSVVITIAVFILGLATFHRAERTFTDTV